MCDKYYTAIICDYGRIVYKKNFTVFLFVCMPAFAGR